MSDRPVPVRTYLDFEKPIAELESKVSELKALEGGQGVQISDEIKKLEQKAKAALVDTYGKLTPWQKTQDARHPERPH
ncbi:MAG: acetyl-CoA carboxylase carboxyl transferase subunit alpha, partial [Hyphomicrobium sp.]